MRKNLFLLSITILICNDVIAQDNDSTALSIKLSVFELTTLSMPHASLGFEKMLSRKSSIEVGGGYVYYSVDETNPASGYTVYGKYNFIFKQRKYVYERAIGLGIFYTKAQLYGPLLYKTNNYFEYKNTDFQKERVGLSLEYKTKYYFRKNTYIELNGGLSFTHFSTTYEDNAVVQDDFRNGFIFGEVLNIPVPVFQFKIGHVIK
jgi:hypothetical protein